MILHLLRRLGLGLAGVLLGLLFVAPFTYGTSRLYAGLLWLGFTLVWCAGMVRDNRR